MQVSERSGKPGLPPTAIVVGHSKAVVDRCAATALPVVAAAAAIAALLGVWMGGKSAGEMHGCKQMLAFRSL